MQRLTGVLSIWTTVCWRHNCHNQAQNLLTDLINLFCFRKIIDGRQIRLR